MQDGSDFLASPWGWRIEGLMLAAFPGSRHIEYLKQSVPAGAQSTERRKSVHAALDWMLKESRLGCGRALIDIIELEAPFEL